MDKRKKGIGGTDISAIVGMNPFKTKLDVFLDKTGQIEPIPDNENMWWGREMEPVLKKRYERETGLQVFVPPVDLLPYRLQSPEWYAASPDGLIEPSLMVPTPVSQGGVDFKTSGRPDEWGEPGTDEVPQHYIIQAEWYMGLTGAQWWDIAVLLMGFTRRFAIYRINRDDELIEGLTEAGAKFWQDHVLTGNPPPLDGSKSATEYLKRKYPQDSGPMLEPTDGDILLTINRYREIRETIRTFTFTETKLENQLKDLIGDCAGLQGEWGKITWKKNKDGQTLDYKAMAAAHPEIAAQFMKPKSGARVFRPYFKEK